MRHFLRRLSSIKQLPDVTTDFSRFMYTHHATIVIGDDPNKTLHVARALIDTGALMLTATDRMTGYNVHC